MASIRLPEGHEWAECKSAPLSASETLFECTRCGATFWHDMIDNEQKFEDGNGACEDNGD